MPLPKTKSSYNLNGDTYEDVEHLVADEDPDTALCGADQADVPWNIGLPLCMACVAIDQGRMN